MKIFNGTGKEVVIYDISTCEMKDMKICVTKESKEIHRFTKEGCLMVAKEIDNQKLLYGKIPYCRETYTNAMGIPSGYDVIIVNEDYFLFLGSMGVITRNLYLLGLPVYDERGKEIIGYQGLVERRF